MTHNKRKKRALPMVITIVAALLVLAIAAYFGYGKFLEAEFPIKYENYVERYSRENGLDKYFVYAVIKTESGFRPDALSNVGARGLMQIMEDTFEWVKFKQGDESTVYYDMYDPQTNIRYGCYLLGYLMEEFGDIETAAAAYHIGRGRVNEWLGDSSISSDGVHLDVIPASDTAHYVSKITKAVEIYKRLYDK
ncbi:MAG: lytic transglycosylase domain-containing protein [Oscillospiraceae bacterium]